ncbi:Hypothetical protein I595_3206 [Croceitalea dokdonensis DOKDO 023]|uniref:Uncharacterized protein n=1 Tax=Croceitalea dokdonensis DOKDO 023 TaxID=1300341 RepID=A0A0P7AS08_9FLAO|nr:hypothetical protein [Croceitalea dokdonensis]KPM30709.1 Hypothetical protein I595_3206 [Croceitalea dokdonensis DOKDO 023]
MIKLSKYFISQLFPLLTVLVLVKNGQAQQDNLVTYPQLGLSFEIPEGWSGQEIDNGYLMGSDTTPGFILVTTHDLTTISAIQKELSQKFEIGPNSKFFPVGAFETIDSKTVGNTFTGTISGTNAKAFICGVLNVYGLGLTIISAASEGLFSNSLREKSLEVAKSAYFENPDLETENSINYSEAKDWVKKFSNCRLTYMESHTSYGTGGYGKKVKIDLCGQGYFNHSAYNSLSVSGGGYNGGYGSNTNGAGTWTMIEQNGDVILRLTFNSGEVYEYTVTIDHNDKTFLNGKRYFRVYSGKYGPNCG